MIYVHNGSHQNQNSIGRYIIASTTAKYNEPENIFSVPHDLVFPCATHNQINGTTATLLADMVCVVVGVASFCFVWFRVCKSIYVTTASCPS